MLVQLRRGGPWISIPDFLQQIRCGYWDDVVLLTHKTQERKEGADLMCNNDVTGVRNAVTLCRTTNTTRQHQQGGNGTRSAFVFNSL